MDRRTFRLPDNWHAHLRTHELLRSVYHHFNIYGRVMCMGNTLPLVETASEAISYRNNIKKLEVLFEPVMTIMLTADTTPEIIFEAAQKGVKFVKFIPIGTSTGAFKGLRLDDFKELFKIFPAIIENDMHLLLHAELMFEGNGTEVSLIEREVRAISAASMFHFNFPDMKITIEHASTVNMIRFVELCDSENVRATLTPHHGILEYSDVFNQKEDMVNPFNYCLPVLKREMDRQAVVRAMVSGDERFFAGTDAAPHWALSKTGINPPAGIFFGSSEYLRYLEIFEREGAINKFEDFTSRFGAQYYGYPLNKEKITVVQEEWIQPKSEYDVGFCMGGEALRWKIVARSKVI